MQMVVIGGGISGLGVAWEAARRGLGVLLLERNKCGHGVSNNSLRIIHGGFRYLQNFDFRRVCESAQAQKNLLNFAPDHVAPFPCLMPLSAIGLKSRVPIELALGLYRVLTGNRNVGRTLSAKDIESQCPTISSFCKHGALLWYDAIMKDPLLFMERVRLAATSCGLVVREDCAVESVERHSQGFRINTTDGQSLFSRVVVNTAGNSPIKAEFRRAPEIKWGIGYNLVFNRPPVMTQAFALASMSGRAYFLVPRADKLAVGTRYLFPEHAEEALEVPQLEIASFILELNQAWPGQEFRVEDISKIEAGWLAMHGGKSSNAVPLAREIIIDHKGFVDLVSVKFTTFSSQANRAVNLCSKYF